MSDENGLYSELKAFFATPFWYLLLGCLFLIVGYALSAHGRTHSALVFIVVIMGVTLVLYGTGTQAAGTAGGGKWNVAIAGGAGVLALVLGFSVVEKRREIGEVFNRQRDYALVRLKLPNSTEIPVDLGKFDVQAHLSGHMPLPLAKTSEWVEILVPIPEDDIQRTEVTVTFAARDELQPNQIDPRQRIDIPWASGGREIAGFSNELINLYEFDLKTSKPRSLSLNASLPGDGEPIQVTPQ